MKTALVILFDGAEEIEAIAPIDILRRAGARTETAALGGSLRVKGRSGIEFFADALFESAAQKTFDAVVLPGGPGVKKILEEGGEALELLKKFFVRHAEAGKIAAAICAAPHAFQKFGILEGRASAEHTSFEAEITGGRPGMPVVRDGNIITSRGAGTAVEFALEIASALVGGGAARGVAESICFKQE